MDSHSFFADLDTAVFSMGIRIQLQSLKKLPYEEFPVIQNTKKVKNKRAVLSVLKAF